MDKPNGGLKKANNMSESVLTSVIAEEEASKASNCSGYQS
jgi:hypothetical protein